MKNAGKPYAGKPQERIEEGVRGVVSALLTLLYWQKIEINYSFPLPLN